MYEQAKITTTGNFKSIKDYTDYEIEQIKEDLKYYDGQLEINGKLAQAFGFEPGDQITHEQFTNLLLGKDKSGRQITSGRARVNGFDNLFITPKSVSIEAEVNGNEEIREINNQAVDKVMEEIERDHIGTRRGKGGAIKEDTGKLAYVKIVHNTTRENDPHLHTHVVVPNITETADGKYLSLDGKRFLKSDFKKAYGKRYEQILAKKLQEAGYSISFSVKQNFRLDRISLEEEEQFSKRHKAIQKQKNNGMKDFEAWAKTRPEKDEKITQAELKTKWRREQAKISGKIFVGNKTRNRERTKKQIEEWSGKHYKHADIATKRKFAKYSVEADQERTIDRCRISNTHRFQLAIRRATEGNSRTDILGIYNEYQREQMRAGLHADLSLKDFKKQLNTEVKKEHIQEFIDKNGTKTYTSIELQRKEKFSKEINQINYLKKENYINVISNIEEQYNDWESLKEREIKAMKKAVEITPFLKKVFKDYDKYTPDEHQKKAIIDILGSNKQFDVIQGDAGSGKTTMMKALKEICDRNNIEVIGLAQGATAAKKLEIETGIKATTVADYIHNPDKEEFQDEQKIVIMDEASMVGTRDMYTIKKKILEKGDKFRAIGDTEQLASISAGQPFENDVAIAREKGELIELKKNHRQNKEKPGLFKGCNICRDGDTKKGIKHLDKNHRPIEIIQDRKKRLERGFNLHYEYKEKGEELKILTGANRDRIELNKLIFREEIRRGNIDKNEVADIDIMIKNNDGSVSIQENGMYIAPGTKIKFKQGSKKYGVENGLAGEITQHKNDMIEVETELGDRKEIDLKEYAFFDYGYAETTFSSQGQTYDNVAIINDTNITPLGTMRNQLVNLTRAKENVYIIADDKERLLKNAEISDIAGKDKSALDGTEELNKLNEKCNKLNKDIERIDRLEYPEKEIKKVKEEAQRAEKIMEKEDTRVRNSKELENEKERQIRREQEEVRVSNKFKEKELDEKGMTDMYKDDFKEVEEKLNENVDIPQERKQQIADYLGSNQHRDIWKYTRKHNYKAEDIINLSQYKITGQTEYIDNIKKNRGEGYTAELADKALERSDEEYTQSQQNQLQR